MLITGITELSAAPLRRADVGADPAWVLHLDCDGVRPTAIGQFLLSEMEKPEIQAKFAAFQSIFSFDPRTQLHGLTLYSASTRSEEGVLLVYADFNPDRLTTLAKAAREYQSTKYKRHIIHSWIDEKKKRDPKPRVYAAILNGRVIFAQREGVVARALDVMEGAAPRLASSNVFPQLGVAGDTSFLEGAARKLDFSESDPNSAIFRLSKLIRLQMAEAQGRVTATLTLEANDEDVAGHVAAIAKGLLALMKLQNEKPESVQLAEAITLEQHGPQVVARATLPGDQVVAMIKADAARKAAKRARKE